MRHPAQCYCLDDEFIYWIVTSETWQEPERFEGVHSILLVYQGELHVRIGERHFTLTSNDFSDIIDLVPLELISVSPDLRAVHLFFTERFLGSLIKNHPPFPFSYMLEMNESPVFHVSEEFIDTYRSRLAMIESALRNSSHHFQPEMLRSAFWMFLLDVADAYMHRADSRLDGSVSGQMRMLFLRFMHLLPRYVREEHSVGFYASQLCITPQYLNRVVRKMSGRAASDAINMLLVGEVIKLLDDTDMTVQEIADRLHFADQATMARFFKRQKGVPPTEYRKLNRCRTQGRIPMSGSER